MHAWIAFYPHPPFVQVMARDKFNTSYLTILLALAFDDQQSTVAAIPAINRSGVMYMTADFRNKVFTR